MSYRENPVSKVLVTTGNQDLLAAGNDLDSLTLGQIGIFDADTNVSVDETTTSLPRKVFFAVAVDRDGDGVKDDIEVSAGQAIELKKTKSLTFRPHTAAQDLILDIVDYGDAECDSDYSVKIEVRNQEIYRIQGHNQFTKTFSVRTACCVGNEVDQDGNLLTKLLRNAINADETGMFTAKAITRQAVTAATHGVAADLAEGDDISDDDIDDLIAYNNANPGSEVYTDVRITFNTLALQNFCSVNLKYFHPRKIFAIASALEDLTCIGGAVETAQEIAYEEGNGYDIKQKEYNANGPGKIGPYVTSNVTGVAKYIQYFADETEEYDQTMIEADVVTDSGFNEYANHVKTIIATPATSTTTRDALIAAIDSLFAGLGFDELASDATAADVDPAVVEATEDKGVDDDGIA